MIDELREEAIVKKVGGRFKLSTLIQKRLVQLNAGARPLVDPKNDNKMQIVINEIMQDKIYLDTETERASGRGRAAGPPNWISATIMRVPLSTCVAAIGTCCVQLHPTESL